ncbi:LOW QUALITY PROTEIN: hypothetical protein KUTeg_018889 [Tegillarca granosa]|uniref:B30.2/SPRY domain-containing protein n=1 Tax=Tegillarca granosa TaxID=220873 RepID=A0ABQ9EAY0_TEGGR|nr:LOW QUALITY PROTEIN: hypothetical protein KUTeg_018889 [Tegillarca granosa]
MAGSSGSTESLNSGTQETTDRLKSLYPAVNEDEAPLPRCWSTKDKFNYIGLSQNNLRVHYKGVGKTHKDAASVRALHPIPAACGIYYFEVKVISKGRDGYMGIGLSAQGVNNNRLPGWDKNSYGYHGDDGHSFCSSGTGQPYGPTFTTGDVIGCCINLIENTCFYTKNGVNLGIAFTDLPTNLYPTVGLQTPGEVVEANFGQSPFVFDIEDYMREWRMKTRLTIERFPVNDKKGEWQTTLQRIVLTYMVHHGYCASSEAFAKSTGQTFQEEIQNTETSFSWQDGRSYRNYTGTLSGIIRTELKFIVYVKIQFIEMVNGTDSEVRGPAFRSPKSRHGSGSNKSSPSLSPVHYSSSHSQRNTPVGSRGNSPNRTIGVKGHSSASGSQNNSQYTTQAQPPTAQQQTTQQQQQNNQTNSKNDNDLQTILEEEMNSANVAINGKDTKRFIENEDVEMTDGLHVEETNNITNGNSEEVYMNGDSHHDCDKDDDMDVDSGGSTLSSSNKRQLCGGSQTAIEKMLQFGRELHVMSQQLKQSYGLPKQPPLELIIAQSTECYETYVKSRDWFMCICQYI